jgi:hypothetical protein
MPEKPLETFALYRCVPCVNDSYFQLDSRKYIRHHERQYKFPAPEGDFLSHLITPLEAIFVRIPINSPQPPQES